MSAMENQVRAMTHPTQKIECSGYKCGKATPTKLKLLLSSGLAVLFSLGVVLSSPLFGGGLIFSGHRADFIQFEA